MTARHLYRPFAGQYVIGQEDGDVLQGGPKSDYLIGHPGEDIFTFAKGGGHDYVVGFERGVDKLDVHSSIKQISWHDTPQGIEVYYGQFGQGGPDHFLLVHVHSLDLSDFAFV